MRKDYARERGLSARRKSAGTRRPRVDRTKWVLFAAALVFAALAIFLYAQTRAGGIFFDWLAVKWTERMHSASAHSARSQTALPAPARVFAEHPDEGVKFDFYGELPEMKVVPPETVLPVGSKPQVISGYLLVIGVWPTQAEASRVRLSLLLAGIDSQIMPLEAGATTSGFQLVMGPYHSQKEAGRAQKHMIDRASRAMLGEVVENSQINPI